MLKITRFGVLHNRGAADKLNYGAALRDLLRDLVLGGQDPE